VGGVDVVDVVGGVGIAAGDVEVVPAAGLGPHCHEPEPSISVQ
jgi:hypothetical protein